MPVETKEILDYLGLKAEDIKSIDDLKSSFDKEFVRSAAINEDHESVKKIMGKVYGTLENEIKKAAKAHELDVDFDSEELKGKKVTEKLKVTLSLFDTKTKSVIEDLKTKVGQGNDEKVKDWESKYEKLSTKYSDTKKLLDTTAGDFEAYKSNSANELKGFKLNIHKKDVYNKAKFIPDINDFTKKGFINDFEERYSFDLDEQENLVITDKKGQRIPNPKTTGTFYGASDLLESELVKAKLYALNPDGGKKLNPSQQSSSSNQHNGNNTNLNIPTRKIATPLA